MAKKYKIRRGFRMRHKDVSKIKCAIDELSREHGLVEPKHIIEHGRAKSSPFHTYLEWDNKKAAVKWRESQARLILRSIEVIYENKPPVRYTLHIQTKKSAGYATHAQIMDDEDLKDYWFEKALDDLIIWFERYEGIAKFVGIRSYLQKAIQMMRKKRKKGNSRRA